MNWLPKERRNLFIIVVLTTVMTLALIYFGLIGSQHDTLSKIATNKATAENKLQSMEKTIKDSSLTVSQLAGLMSDLSHAETDMASGDLYSWTYGTVRQFKQPYKVEIPDIGPPKMGEVDLLPAFPYKQITFSVTGKAYYQDFGKFVADFENAFPHAQLVNLNMSPSLGDGEQISFSMDIIALVKPNAS